MLKNCKKGLHRIASATALLAMGVIAGCSDGQNGASEAVSMPEERRLATVVTSVNRDLPPTTAQVACPNESDYFVADGTSDPNGLLNRHVLCVKDTKKFEIDVKNSQGVLVMNAGEITLDAFWSVHGPSSGLEKKALLKLKYTYKAKPQDPGAPALTTPTFKIIPKIECIGQSGTTVNCTQTLPMSSFTASGVKPLTKALPIQWTDSSVKEVATTIGVTLMYTTDGSTPAEGRGDRWSPRFDNWILRCDVGIIKADSKGCVFKDASAVWDFSSTGDAAQVQQHIAYAFANFPEIPGKFRLQEGKRSVAMDEPATGYQSLSRTMDSTIRDENRKVAGQRCDAQYGASKSTACPAGSRCHCDEFPMASTHQGAASVRHLPHKYSVRMVDERDNLSGGGQANAFYLRERVTDNEKFWVYVGNAPTTPPTVPPPPPPPVGVNVTSSFKVSHNVPGSGRQTVYYSVTNISSNEMVGPFHYYFPNLGAGVTLEGGCKTADGIPYVNMGHARIGTQTTVHFTVTGNFPAGVAPGMTGVIMKINGTSSCADAM